MKIIAIALFLASSACTASAFSAVAPPSAGSTTGNGSESLNPDSIDKTMRGIDDESGFDFDPVAGENPALTRNNNGEVWVPQVRTNEVLKKML
ncbi:MAG: hypothetical protein ACI8RD_001054 [Bacillariaceae sp.]|jgi:hypothetical protein